MGKENQETRLQVLICTLGEVGIRRIIAADHPHVPGVEYLVSWQLPDMDIRIPEELKRPDFNIIKNRTRGLSKNRNLAIEAASAPLCLISDDDVTYSTEGLNAVIDCFNKNPENDILTFRYESRSDKKYYPSFPFSLSSPPKGYYVSSIEIAFRREKIMNKIRFNEDFGIGARFSSGEEEIFIHDALKAGIRGKYIPISIATHDAPSTSTRLASDPAFIRTKGAVLAHTHPWSWPLRMMSHAWRNSRVANGITTFTYIKSWLYGAFSK